MHCEAIAPLMNGEVLGNGCRWVAHETMATASARMQKHATTRGFIDRCSGITPRSTAGDRREGARECAFALDLKGGELPCLPWTSRVTVAAASYAAGCEISH